MWYEIRYVQSFFAQVQGGSALRDVKGDEPCALYILLKGSLSVFGPSKKEEVGVLSEPGSVFGEMCVINDRTWPGEARAKEDTSVLEVPADLVAGIVMKRRQIMALTQAATKVICCERAFVY